MKKQDSHEYDHDYEEEGISLKELLWVLLRGKKIIAVVTAVVVLATFVGSLLIPNLSFGSKGDVQTVIQLYFNGIEEGLTPEGDTYEVSEVKNTDILEKALDAVTLSGNPSAAQVASCLSVEAILPEDVAKTLQRISGLKTEQLMLERLDGLVINPDTYILNFNVKNKLKINKDEGRELLDAIALEYRQWLIKKYSKNEEFADIFAVSKDLQSLDYIQQADIMNNRVTAMEEYVQVSIMDDTFVAGSTGLSKADLLDAINSLQEVECEMLYTRIAGYYVTKDKQKSVAIYEKLAMDKERDYSTYKEQMDTLQTLLQNFKREQQILVIGDSETSSVTLQQQSEQYDELARNYIQMATKASSAGADASYYRSEAQRIRGAENTRNSNAQTVKDTELLIKNFQQRLMEWTEITNLTVKEYNEAKAYKAYAEQLLPALDYEHASSINLPLNLAIGLVAGLVLGVLIVLFKQYMREEEISEKELLTGGDAE